VYLYSVAQGVNIIQVVIYTVLYSQNYVFVESLGTIVEGNIKSVNKKPRWHFHSLPEPRKFLEK
jgi:hypothetical protein